MIPWTDMDERERAVWSATVATTYVANWNRNIVVSDRQTMELMDVSFIQGATNVADRAVYALREQAKKGPYR